MIAGRAELRPIGLEAAAVQLKSGAGSRFDPQVTAALVAAIGEHPTVLRSPIGSDAELERFDTLFRECQMPETLAPWITASF